MEGYYLMTIKVSKQLFHVNTSFSVAHTHACVHTYMLTHSIFAFMHLHMYTHAYSRASTMHARTHTLKHKHALHTYVQATMYIITKIYCMYNGVDSLTHVLGMCR